MPDETDALITGLRAWTKDHDPHVRAAVELLIVHDHWLYDDGFIAACVQHTQETYISWVAADAYLASDPPCSPGEASVLRAAIDLGMNRWGLSRLDVRNKQRVMDAVRTAVGL